MTQAKLIATRAEKCFVYQTMTSVSLRDVTNEVKIMYCHVLMECSRENEVFRALPKKQRKGRQVPHVWRTWNKTKIPKILRKIKLTLILIKNVKTFVDDLANAVREAIEKHTTQDDVITEKEVQQQMGPVREAAAEMEHKLRTVSPTHIFSFSCLFRCHFTYSTLRQNTFTIKASILGIVVVPTCQGSTSTG